MFGFKIIPKKLLSGMEQSLKDLYGRNKSLTNDNECLRKKLVEKTDEVASLKIQMSETSKKLDFANLHVLHDSDYKCEACKLESPYCHKLSFADRTICVAPKNKVNSFAKKNKTKKTKQNNEHQNQNTKA